MQNAAHRWALTLSLIAASLGLAGTTTASAQPGHSPRGNGPPMHAPGPGPHVMPPMVHVPPSAPHMHSPAMPTNPRSRYGQPPRHWSLDQKAWYHHAERCDRRYRSYDWRTDRFIDWRGRSRRCPR